MDKDMIPAKLYKKIVSLVPIGCVDVILKYNEKYVLVKRATEPLLGSWWVVGGRAFKGESTLETAKRKVRDETGLKARDFRVAGIYEDSYPKSAFGVPTSSVSVVYEAEVDNFDPIIDSTSSDIKLTNKLPHRFLKKLCLNQK